MVVSAAADYGFIENESQDLLNRLDIHAELVKLSDHVLSTEQFLEKGKRAQLIGLGNGPRLFQRSLFGCQSGT
jgi:hypothetical protein